jgi:large-conductance mechanosensitive channel
MQLFKKIKTMWQKDFKNSRVFKDTELIELALAVYLGSVMETLLRSIVTGIIMPILEKILPIDILHQHFKILNIDIAPVLQNTISMIIALVLATMIINFKKYIYK